MPSSVTSNPQPWSKTAVIPGIGPVGALKLISSRCMWQGPSGVNILGQWSAGNVSSGTYRAKYPLVASARSVRFLFANQGIAPSTGAGSELQYDQAANSASLSGGFTLQTLNNTVSYVSGGAGNTVISCSGYNFTGGDIGRSVRITNASGAGWTVATYIITAASANNATLNGNAANAPGTTATAVLAGPGQITVRARLVWAGSNFPLTFNGLRTATIDIGGQMWSDPVGIDMRTSLATTFFMDSFVSAAQDVIWPLGMQSTSGAGEGFHASVDDTPAGTAYGGSYSANQFLYHPVLCMGVTSPRNTPVIGLMGDSILTGVGDTWVNGATDTTRTGDRSFVDFACNDAYGLVKYCRQGEAVNVTGILSAAQASKSRFRFGLMAQTCDIVIYNYGSNDLNGGDTLANLKTNTLAAAAFVQGFGAKFVPCSIPPRTTSSDAWATAGNQTKPGWEANRTGYNDWLRNGGWKTLGFDGFYDICANIEVDGTNALVVNGGLWLTNGAARKYSGDGTHPSHDGNLLMQTSIDTTLFVIS